MLDVVRKTLLNFAPKLKNKQDMKVLIEEEISYVLGGRWITLPDGTRIWIEEDDEEEEGDEFLFG